MVSYLYYLEEFVSGEPDGTGHKGVRWTKAENGRRTTVGTGYQGPCVDGSDESRATPPFC